MKPHVYKVTAERVCLRRGARVKLSEGVLAKRRGLLRDAPGLPGWHEIREAAAWFWRGEEFGHYGPVNAGIAQGATLVESGDPIPTSKAFKPEDPRQFRKFHQELVAKGTMKAGLERGKVEESAKPSRKPAKKKKKAKNPSRASSDGED